MTKFRDPTDRVWIESDKKTGEATVWFRQSGQRRQLALSELQIAELMSECVAAMRDSIAARHRRDKSSEDRNAEA